MVPRVWRALLEAIRQANDYPYYTPSDSMMPMESPSASSAPRRCHTCNSTLENPRNLAVFIDGTANKPGSKNTNVMKLYQKVADGFLGDSTVEQRKFYLKGIGTYHVDRLSKLERVGKFVYSTLEGALAWSVEENVKSAYRWLVDHYQAGDQIYLFGFSRGAYQVRALASVIHEVGLVKKEEREKADEAYDKYLAIDPYNPESMRRAARFKQNFCRYGVRIHFMGVWDTVSSLGLTKKVHITASASVTNACHFRHALALDEHRVKFMPEYFLEMNAYRSVHSSRLSVCDVKEVWFAGCHSDVGGTDRPSDNEISAHHEDINHATPADVLGSHPIHAGNASLSWMRREAVDNGLVFEQREIIWGPQDIDFCTTNSMSFGWMIFEIIPFSHQVSYSGTGEHKWRSHLFRPRSIIPGQQIHDSALSSALYASRATLAGDICIPTASVEVLGGLRATKLPDNGVMTHLLTSLLKDPETTLDHFERVFFLLYSVLGNERTESLRVAQWSEKDALEQPNIFDKFALAIIYDITSNFTASEALVNDTRTSLKDIITSDRQNFPRTVYILRFLVRHEGLRRRFISNDVINALASSLDWTTQGPDEILTLLTMDCLYHLIRDSQLRTNVVGVVRSRLPVALKSRSSNQLLASLKMIASIAQFQQGGDSIPTEPSSWPGFPSEELQLRVFDLAIKGRGLVGSAAVEVLVALKVTLTHEIHLPNILGYLANGLRQLDAGADVLSSESSTNNVNELAHVPLARSELFDEKTMHKLTSTIKSRHTYERTFATLVILELCSNPDFRTSCSQLKVVDTFMQQLKQEGTSLLAAYALMMCLKYDMQSSVDFSRAGPLIVTMVDKCWFDGAIGRVEGREIFRGLMSYDGLRQQVINSGIVDTLVKNLQGGNCHKVRMSLSCLDILGSTSPLGLAQTVASNVNCLRDNKKVAQRKAIKVLAALARTSAGEEAIKPHVTEIVQILLSFPPCSRESLGPAAVLYHLSKNETLRKMILESQEFKDVKRYLKPNIPRLQMARAT